MVTMREEINVVWSYNTAKDSQCVHFCPSVHISLFLLVPTRCGIEGKERVGQLAKSFTHYDTDILENV